MKIGLSYDPFDTRRFAQEMNDARLRICFNTGQAAFYSGEKIGEGVRALGDKIRVFHIHDTRRGQDLHISPFLGVIDWADFAAALRDIHYEGVFSLIFCSQFDVPGWHENLYDPTLADAICDRIVYDSYIIRIEGDTMRKRKGIME